MIQTNLGALFEENLSLIVSAVVAILLITGVNLGLKSAKKKMLKKAKSKKQVSNVKLFTRIANITITGFIILVSFFSYIGSWTGLGVVAGLLTAALGFALQRPITGVAAWIMVVLKKPFLVGDRIMIGDVKGDVYDITLTHVYLDEIGGDVGGDLISGRSVMIPNYLLFENNIINYTLIHNYILGEVATLITYESDLDKAIAISKRAAEKFSKEFAEKLKQDVVVRVKMEESGILLKTKFFAPADNMHEISSKITKEIYDLIKKEKNIEIAYPHMEIVLKDKKLFR